MKCLKCFSTLSKKLSFFKKSKTNQYGGFKCDQHHFSSIWDLFYLIQRSWRCCYLNTLSTKSMWTFFFFSNLAEKNWAILAKSFPSVPILLHGHMKGQQPFTLRVTPLAKFELQPSLTWILCCFWFTKSLFNQPNSRLSPGMTFAFAWTSLLIRQSFALFRVNFIRFARVFWSCGVIAEMGLVGSWCV